MTTHQPPRRPSSRAPEQGKTAPRPDPRDVGASFPKSRRVRDRREFQRIQGRGIRLGGPHFLVMAMRQSGPKRPARLGITASKKSGESVQRSRIRRLLREAFRLHKREFPDGWDFVVIAREGTDRLSLDQIVGGLRAALEKLKVAQNRPPDAGGPRPRQNKPRPGGPPRP